jgi:hypothetical protein
MQLRVIILIWVMKQYKTYKAQMETQALNRKIVSFLEMEID